MRLLILYPTRLFTLMAVCFIGFSSLLLLLSGIVYYGTYSDIAYREIRAAKQELLDETSQKLASYVAGVQDTARFLVTNTLVQQYLSAPPASAYDFVSKSRDLYDEFLKMATVKAGLHSIELYTDWLLGYPPFQQSFMHPIADAEEEGWLERMERTDGSWIGAHDTSVAHGSVRLVSYVHRIIGIRDETLGIVKINIAEPQLFDLLSSGSRAAAAANSYVILDAREQYIASQLPLGIELRPQADELVQALEAANYSVIRSRNDASGWLLLQVLSKDVLSQGVREIRTLVAAAMAALILLSVPLSLWLSRRLTSPIRGMVEGMHAVEKGDFNVRMKASSIQEYLYLSAHFNRMVHRLKDLIDRLDQEHRDRRQVEIQLLHAQIKPHFLYNTLDLIHWKALDHNAPEISGMVQQLSKLFRIGLSNDKWYITVRDELAHARCYMAIQEYRQQYPIEYEEQAESDLLDCYIPKIVLQPFLENAVIHGFRHRDRSEKAYVLVQVARREEAGESLIAVTIADNGRGLPEGFELGKAGGIGIRNVLDRIQLFCGPKYGVSIEPGEAGGTRVTLRLPIVSREEEMEQRTRSRSDEHDSIGG